MSRRKFSQEVKQTHERTRRPVTKMPITLQRNLPFSIRPQFPSSLLCLRREAITHHIIILSCPRARAAKRKAPKRQKAVCSDVPQIRAERLLGAPGFFSVCPSHNNFSFVLCLARCDLRIHLALLYLHHMCFLSAPAHRHEFAVEHSIQTRSSSSSAEKDHVKNVQITSDAERGTSGFKIEICT